MIDYSLATLPDTPVILGVQLKPFSIGHLLLMDRYGCDYVSGGITDFILALSICSRTYEEFLEFKDGYCWKHSFWGLGPKIKIKDEKYFYKYNQAWGEALRKAIRKHKDFDLHYHIRAFNRYMEQGRKEPDFKPNDDLDVEPSGGHWMQSVLLTLTGELNYTQSEAYNCPFGKALSDFYKFLEKKGAGRIPTQMELDVYKEWREKAKQAKGLANVGN